MLNTTEDLSSRVKREAVGCNKFFIAACSPALIEHEPTLCWAKVQHSAASALASRRKHSSWVKNCNFPDWLDIWLNLLIYWGDSAQLLVWLFKALDPLCYVPLSEIFSNFWIFEYFQLNFQHYIHSSSSSDIVGLIVRLDSIFSQLSNIQCDFIVVTKQFPVFQFFENCCLLLSWNPALAASRRLPPYLSCFVENSWNKFWSERVSDVSISLYLASWERRGWCRPGLQVIQL